MGPLSPAGDAVSEYPQDIDYERDVRDNFAAFDLEVPRLTRALSTEPPGVETIVEAGPWDVIYIDGSHDEDVVLRDYHHARQGLAERGLIVFDDAALHLPFDPPAGLASRGHPGPSNVVNDVVRAEMQLLGSVGHNVIFSAASADPRT